VNRLKTAVLIDAWFPFVGGGQIHVKELTQTLSQNHQVNSKLFYPPHPHLLVRLVWSLLVPFQIAFHHFFTGRFHILHSHGFNSGFSAKFTSLLLRVPVIHTAHGSHLMDQQKKSIKARLEKILLTRIHYSAQITVAANFFKYKNVNKPHLIRNGVNLKLYSPQTKFNQPTILFIGRQHPDKGFDTLQKAFLTVKSRIPQVQLKSVISANLSPQKLAQIYARSHIFVLPSRAEGQPITLLEAWANKLPVVVTKVGDNPYLVEDGKTGFLVPPNDPDALADKIIDLFSHPDKAKLMGQKGYTLVASKYTWDHIAAQTFKLYQSVLESKF